MDLQAIWRTATRWWTGAPKLQARLGPDAPRGYSVEVYGPERVALLTLPARQGVVPLVYELTDQELVALAEGTGSLGFKQTGPLTFEPVWSPGVRG
jgi:hypothetical protein